MVCMTEYDVEHSHGMHVVHDGPQQAPLLLLIHGSGASGGFWSPMVPALAGHRHVIRVDLPGCGQSPPAPSYGVPVQAGRVAALLDDLGLGQVAAVGHSSGGYVATALAEQRPDLVRSLALISTGPSLDALLPQPALLRVLLAPPLGGLLWSRRSDAMIRKGISATVARPVDIPDDLVAEVRGITYRAFRTVLRRNTAYLTERRMPERLTALEVPVLVIFGAADPRWEPSSAHQYDSVPKARIELLPGVGHIPILEAPEATSELLLGFTATDRWHRPVPLKPRLVTCWPPGHHPTGRGWTSPCRRQGRLPGVSMAGFRHHAPAPVDIGMVAHPGVTLFVDLSEGAGIGYHTHSGHQRGSVVVGLLPGELRVTGWGAGECLQIRLEPVAAAAVLGASAELNGTVVSLEEVWGRDAGRAGDRLRAAASWDERFTIAVDVLGRRLAARPPVDPEVAHAWRRTRTSRGRVRVDGLADEIGWSRQRLWSRFRSQLGITPKRAAQLVRFDYAAHLLAAGHAAAGVATESGYVDQSHLHREVRAFAGLTPTAVAVAPWLAIDDVAWPAASPTRAARR